MTHQTTRVGKQHLLEVAESLFTEQGYQAVSIRDIAQAVGVTSAALYYYFPNKEALFSEVLAFHVEGLSQRLRAAAEKGTDHRDRLKRMLMTYSEHVAVTRSPLFLLRFKSGKVTEAEKEKIHERHAQHMKALIQPFEEELRSTMASGALKPLPENISPASLLLGLLHGLIQHRRTSQDFAITPEDIHVILEIFWEGISRQTEKRRMR